MPVISDSYNRAYDACDDVLIEDGRFPTVEAVRQRIDTNSPAIIKRAINDWLLNFAKKHKERMRRPDLPEALMEAVDNIWKTATDQSKASFESESKAFYAREMELESHIAFHKCAYEKLKEDEELQKSHYEKQILILKDELKEATFRLNEKEDALLFHRDQLITTQKEHSATQATLVELRRSYDEQLIAWKDRFDQEHNWHLKRIEEEKDSIRQGYKSDIERLKNKVQTEVLEKEILSTRLTQMMTRLDGLLATLSKQESELSILKESLGVKRHTAKRKALPVRRNKTAFNN